MMLRWPRKCCNARVSTPSLANLKPQPWRSRRNLQQYARARVMGSYISNRNVCAQTWNLFNDDRCTLSENWTRDLSGTALVSAAVRARPVAHSAAFEAQIPTEVLRQDQSRSSVHHEGCAGKAALPVPPG